MAASTSTSSSATVYDVFISHRGPDVKQTLATNLHSRLKEHGLEVFLDYLEMEAGETIDSQIKGAIASASVQVAILSPRYAESTWCLDELKHMLESKSPVIPVFYKVKPTDLRWTRGKEKKSKYAEDLSNLEKKETWDSQPRHNFNTIENWRNALSQVSNISGFELEAFNGDEEKLLDKVVECVLKRVKRPELDVAQYPTGLEDKAQDFERRVLSQEKSGRVQVVGIAGLGGVGKTTLATKLFNQKRSNYSKHCFLFDVKENATSLHCLQKNLLKGLKIKDQSVDSVSEGKGKLRKYLSDSRVFIVLDDVDHVDQVHALLPVDVLHPESLILITSRDKHVLAQSGIQESSIYELTGLDEHHSRELFCSYAFFHGRPPSDFESLVDRFVKACHGLPLSLKVIGGLVYGNDHKSDWEAQLEKLRQTLPQEIQKRLQISYDALDENEKNIFLDIACFFIGKDRDMAIKIWNGSGWTGSLGFRTLQNKCLVELDWENTIKMHDHVRDLGRALAKHPELPRRLWRGIEDINDLMLHSNGKLNVRGVKVLRIENLVHLRGLSITNLQFLDVDIMSEHIPISYVLRWRICHSIWLRWRNCHLIWLRWRIHEFTSLPPWIPLKNLRVLEVHGKKLKTLWQLKSEAPLQLRELRICAPLKNLPKSIGKLKQLEKLHLLETELKELPSAFGELSSLEELRIRGSSLKSIRGWAELAKLRSVNVSDCSHLEELLGFENLRSLEEFQVSGCYKLKRIQGSGEFTKLRSVNISCCSDLEELPVFENLRSLEEFQVSKCPKLKSIRESGELAKLRSVNVSDCSDLEELPGFENPRSLEQFQVSRCPKLKSIRGSGELAKLRSVNVSDCSDLEELPGFENPRSLEEFQVSRCPKLKSIRGSGELAKLRSVNVSDCSDLEELPGFEDSRSLEEFQVSDCPKLKLIRGWAELTKLRIVNIRGCPDLEGLQGFENLRSLEKLEVSKCPRLKTIRGSAELTKLRSVCVRDCSDLEELPGLENSRLLEEFKVHGCPKLKSTRGWSAELTKLRIVHVESFYDSEELPGFENWRSLEELRVSFCMKLKSIRGSAELTELRSVNVSDCSDLEELLGFEDLRSLEELQVSECPKLKSIRGWEELTKLVRVKIKGCKDLEELPSFKNWRSLEELEVSRCRKLKSIQGCEELTKLRILSVQYCSGLEELQGFENVRSMEELKVGWCGKLKSIRGSAELTKLRIVSVQYCSDLEELPGFERWWSFECPKLSAGALSFHRSMR